MAPDGHLPIILRSFLYRPFLPSSYSIITLSSFISATFSFSNVQRDRDDSSSARLPRVFEPVTSSPRKFRISEGRIRVFTLIEQRYLRRVGYDNPDRVTRARSSSLEISNVTRPARSREEYPRNWLHAIRESFVIAIITRATRASEQRKREENIAGSSRSGAKEVHER